MIFLKALSLILGGFMFNYLNRQLLVVFYIMLMAMATTLTPIIKSYTVFIIVSVFFGFGEGGLLYIIMIVLQKDKVFSLTIRALVYYH